MLNRNDQLDAWDRENFFHPSTHLAQHARGESPVPHHHRRRGRLHRRPRRQEEPRRLRRALLRQCRLWPDRRSPRRSPSRRRKLAYYHAYVGHGTEASITLAHMIAERAPEHMNHVYFGLVRLGRQRDQRQAGLVLQQRSRPAGEEEDHLALARLSRLRPDDRLADRTCAVPQCLRPAAVRRSCIPRRPISSAAPTASMDEEEFSQYCADQLEAMIRRRGTGDRRRLHRRAGARHRRHRAAAGRLLGEDPGGARPPRHPADRRRGRHRLRPARHRCSAPTTTGIKPDIITIAKGLTSAYAPLSGSIISDKVWAVLEQGTDEMGPIGHGWTYSAHPLCAAAGVANLELIDSLGLVENARRGRRLFPLGDGRRGRRPSACRRRARRGPAGGGRIRRGQGRAPTSSIRRRRSARRSRRRCSSAASSPGPCRRATSSASRRRSA